MLNAVREYLRTQWKELRYKRKYARYVSNPRDFWEKRGGRDNFEEYPDDILADQVEFFTKKFSNLKVRTALEIGCGYGRVLRITRRSMKDASLVVGADFARPQLNKAKTVLGQECRFVQATATRLPFKNDAFELVYTIGVLMHIPPKEAKKALSEIIRISSRYVLFSEGIFTHFNMFGLDFRKEYEALGLKTLECIDNPYRVLRPKPIQFVIMKKREKIRSHAQS